MSEATTSKDAGRITMQIGDGENTEPVEFRLRLDVVDIYVAGTHRAAFDRGLLCSWFHEPWTWFSTDDVTWTLDGHRRIIFSLAETAGWLLPPAVEQLLRDQL